MGGPGSNGNKKVLHTPRSLEDEPDAVWCDISRHPWYITATSFMKQLRLLVRIDDNNNNDNNLKKSEKKDKYLDLTREIKKMWNMKVTIVPIVIGVLGTVTKGLLKGLELADGWRLSKRQHCWGRPEYWDESWRLEETCCHSNSSEKPSANIDVKNSRGVNNNNNIQ